MRQVRIHIPSTHIHQPFARSPQAFPRICSSSIPVFCFPALPHISSVRILIRLPPPKHFSAFFPPLLTASWLLLFPSPVLVPIWLFSSRSCSAQTFSSSNSIPLVTTTLSVSRTRCTTISNDQKCYLFLNSSFSSSILPHEWTVCGPAASLFGPSNSPSSLAISKLQAIRECDGSTGGLASSAQFISKKGADGTVRSGRLMTALSVEFFSG